MDAIIGDLTACLCAHVADGGAICIWNYGAESNNLVTSLTDVNMTNNRALLQGAY